MKDLKQLNEVYQGEIYKGYIIYETVSGFYNAISLEGSQLNMYESIQLVKSDIDYIS